MSWTILCQGWSCHPYHQCYRRVVVHLGYRWVVFHLGYRRLVSTWVTDGWFSTKVTDRWFSTWVTDGWFSTRVTDRWFSTWVTDGWFFTWVTQRLQSWFQRHRRPPQPLLAVPGWSSDPASTTTSTPVTEPYGSPDFSTWPDIWGRLRLWLLWMLCCCLHPCITIYDKWLMLWLRDSQTTPWISWLLFNTTHHMHCSNVGVLTWTTK